MYVCIKVCDAEAKRLHVRGYLVDHEELNGLVGCFESADNETVTYMVSWLMARTGPNCTIYVTKKAINDDYILQDFVTYSRRAPYGELPENEVDLQHMYPSGKYRSFSSQDY